MMRFLSLTLVVANADIKRSIDNPEEAKSPCDDICEKKLEDQLAACPEGETCPCSDKTCGCKLDGCEEGEEELIAEQPTEGQPGVGYCQCYFVAGIGQHAVQDIDQNHVRSGGHTELVTFNASDFVNCIQGNESQRCRDTDGCKVMSEGKLLDAECPTTHMSEIGATHKCMCKKKLDDFVRPEARLI